MASIEQAKAAQERMFRENPGKYQQMKAAEDERKRADEKEAQVRRYKAHDIPDAIAKILMAGADEKGRPLVKLPFENVFLKAMQERKRLICLAGSMGTGKTIAVCKHLAALKPGFGDYCFVADFVKLNDHLSTDRPSIDWLYSRSLLVLDEAGTEKETDKEKVLTLLHRRYETDRRTVVISNLSKGEFKQYCGQRLLRRIYDNGTLINIVTLMSQGAKIAYGEFNQNPPKKPYQPSLSFK